MDSTEVGKQGVNCVIQLSSVELWSIVSSFVSLILGVLLGAFSIWVFFVTKKTETDTSSALSKIQGQAEAMQKLISAQMSRLIKGATDPEKEEKWFAFIKTIVHPPKDIQSNIQTNTANLDPALQNEIVCGYILLY
jgi:hypothetical protein